MPTIAERLQIIRGEKSRRSFAEMIGIPASTLKNYEQGDTSPTLETLEAVCEKLCISKRWLMLGEGTPDSNDNSAIVTLTASALQKRIAELEAENKELLKEVAEARKETITAYKQATFPKGGTGNIDVPVSAPSVHSTSLTSDK